jgi:putative nucleotidyltransferase with HDIG domain
MARALTQLRTQMREVGMTVSVWDSAGHLVGKFQPCCQFCQMIHDVGAGCVKACEALAAKVIEENRPMWEISSSGCCILGTPIEHRHRMLGCVIACYLPKELLTGEPLARLCSRVGLDLQASASLIQGVCRHSSDQVEEFLHILTWLLNKEQAVMTAQGELASLSANLANTYEELGLLYAISGSMNVNCLPRDFLRNVCVGILAVTNITAAAGVIQPRRPGKDGKEEIVVVGPPQLHAEQVRRIMKEHLNPLLASGQEAVIDNNFAAAPGDEVRITNLLAVPLATEKAPIGVLIAMNKREGDFDSVDLKLIKSISAQTAVFLEYSWLYADMKDLLMGVLHALTASIDAKDPYTCGHSRRVAAISRRLAEAAGLPPERVQRIYLAGLLHDIGKIGVPESVLRKPGKLTEEEWKLIRGHPSTAAKILSGIGQLDDVVPSILTHHERPDGKGYPCGLSADELPLEGKIIGLADCLDSMTSDRTYRPAMSLKDAVTELRRVSGTQVDKKLVDLLLSMDLKEILTESPGKEDIRDLLAHMDEKSR